MNTIKRQVRSAFLRGVSRLKEVVNYEPVDIVTEYLSEFNRMVGGICQLDKRKGCFFVEGKTSLPGGEKKYFRHNYTMFPDGDLMLEFSDETIRYSSAGEAVSYAVAHQDYRSYDIPLETRSREDWSGQILGLRRQIGGILVRYHSGLRLEPRGHMFDYKVRGTLRGQTDIFLFDSDVSVYDDPGPQSRGPQVPVGTQGPPGPQGSQDAPYGFLTGVQGMRGVQGYSTEQEP